MSVRYEGCTDTSMSMLLFPPGTEVGEETVEVQTIVISYDEVFYIEVHNPEQMARRLRVLAASLDPAPVAHPCVICDSHEPSQYDGICPAHVYE